MRKIVSPAETRQIAQETITEIATIVGSTLGPGGQVVILEQQGSDSYGNPKIPVITKDGVTVAEHVLYRDPLKNTVAQTILQVAKNTVQTAGDGTSTSIILADAMYRAGAKHIKQGVNGIGLYEELKVIKDEVIEILKKMSIPIDENKLVDVARISANGDEEVAQVVSEAIKAVGEDGHISLEDGYAKETKLEKIEGAHYKQGWRKFGALGSHMINDRARNVCDLERPAVLCYAGELKTEVEVSDVLKKVWQLNDQGIPQVPVFPVLFIAYDYSDDVKNHLMAMRVQGKMPIAAIKAPFDGSPNTRTHMMEDLAALLGGQVMARGIIDLTKVSDETLGCADRVVIGPEETVFYKGHGEEAVILERLEDLKVQLNETIHEFDKDNLRLRIGKLCGGIAIIRVGGLSELEMKERKDRIEDALCAAKVAIAEGVLPGGGMALYRIAQAMEPKTIGAQIMKEALEEPVKCIIRNVGEEPAAVLTALKFEANRPGMGYDARNKKFVSLVDAGIIDPLKVTKSALENAVSIVGLLLTTGGAIVMDTNSKDGTPNPLAGLLG